MKYRVYVFVGLVRFQSRSPAQQGKMVYRINHPPKVLPLPSHVQRWVQCKTARPAGTWQKKKFAGLLDSRYRRNPSWSYRIYSVRAVSIPCSHLVSTAPALLERALFQTPAWKSKKEMKKVGKSGYRNVCKWGNSPMWCFVDAAIKQWVPTLSEIWYR